MPRFPWQLELALHHRSLWLYESKVLCLVTLIRDILKGGAHVNHLPHSRGKETDKTGLLRFLQSLSFMVVNAQRGPVIYTSLRDAWGHQSYLWGWKDCSLSWQLKGVNTCRPRLGLYLKKIAKKKKKKKSQHLDVPCCCGRGVMWNEKARLPVFYENQISNSYGVGRRERVQECSGLPFLPPKP